LAEPLRKQIGDGRSRWKHFDGRGESSREVQNFLDPQEMTPRGQGQAKERRDRRTPSPEVCRERKRELGVFLMYLVVLKSSFPSLPSLEVFCFCRII